MSVLSPKRQVTLPKSLCDRLFVQPGDDLVFLEHRGRITIVKKVKGRSDGILSHLKGSAKTTDLESMQDAIATKHRSLRNKKRIA
jgi:bifunctional DNA-binding transcriptional regulator/antitoxin component of YhaV-PrlF toxin-antitoxin module